MKKVLSIICLMGATCFAQVSNWDKVEIDSENVRYVLPQGYGDTVEISFTVPAELQAGNFHLTAVHVNSDESSENVMQIQYRAIENPNGMYSILGATSGASQSLIHYTDNPIRVRTNDKIVVPVSSGTERDRHVWLEFQRKN